MKVVVAGGGVAGCVSAMGLKKLGYEVILIHRPRSFEAYEGFSQRTVEALQRSGCNHALKTIGPLISTFIRVEWNFTRCQQRISYISPRF